MSKKKKSTRSKAEFIQAIRKKLSETKLPEQLQLEKWANIIDVPKFFDSHLTMILHAPDNAVYIKPTVERLKKALKLVEIDIYAI